MTETLLIWRESERAGTAQFGEESAQWDLINVYKYLKGGCKEEGGRELDQMTSRGPFQRQPFCDCESCGGRGSRSRALVQLIFGSSNFGSLQMGTLEGLCCKQ